MDIVKLGTELLQKQLQGQAQPEAVSAATESLLGDGGLDLSSIVQNMMSGGGMADIAQSWLGQGQNKSISVDQVVNILGKEKIAAFIAKLGISPDVAMTALSAVLPQLVDKSSDGAVPGLDSGLGGLADMAKKFF